MNPVVIFLGRSKHMDDHAATIVPLPVYLVARLRMYAGAVMLCLDAHRTHQNQYLPGTALLQRKSAKKRISVYVPSLAMSNK